MRLRVPLSLCYVVLRRILQLAAWRVRSNDRKELEIVVLRHELAVLRRRTRRPTLMSSDRLFLAAASRRPMAPLAPVRKTRIMSLPFRPSGHNPAAVADLYGGRVREGNVTWVTRFSAAIREPRQSGVVVPLPGYWLVAHWDGLHIGLAHHQPRIASPNGLPR